jgi:hypothetical protein
VVSILFNISELNAALSRALAELLGDAVSFNSGRPLSADSKPGEALKISSDESRTHIIYSDMPAFFKAVAVCSTNDRAGTYEIDAAFQKRGVMLDCSRNGVLSVGGAKRMIRYMALMGYNYLMLYTEDTLEVKGYPYFGYMRGQLTKDEIRDIENYCDLFGIELIPCVQTLAHLNQALRWDEFRDIQDIGDILLVGEEKTYKLIEAIIRTCAENFTSRAIHIGMDEAHMVGLGRYLDLHGYRNRFDILSEHLNRVVGICKKYGFSPMMWSDMFFRLAYGDYYNIGDKPFDESVLAEIPANVGMVYWDYYSQDPCRYDSMFAKHKQLNNEVIFAGGAWSWGGFTPNNRFSAGASLAALPQARKNGVKNVFITCWGDDGAECSFLSVLPGLMAFSDICHGRPLYETFKILTGIVPEDFLSLDNNFVRNSSKPFYSYCPEKYILYSDLLAGLFNRHIKPETTALICRETSEKLKALLPDVPDDFRRLFESRALLNDVLAEKCGLGAEIRELYGAKDLRGLERVADERIPALIRRIEAFYTVYQKLWRQLFKPFGLEVMDARIGGLIMRLKTVGQTLRDYANGSTDSIAELEEEVLPYGSLEEDGEYINELSWKRIVSASVI